MSPDIKTKDSPMDHHGNGSLEDLAPTIKRYSYEGKQQFLDIFKMEFDTLEHDKTGNASEWMLFDLDKQNFINDFLKSSDTLFSKSWTTYSTSEQLILIKMMTAEHSAALVAFQDILSAAVEPTGLKWAMQGFSGKTIHGTTRSKQGDGGWAPKRPPRGHSKKWPAVVMEVAVSEHQSKLLSDIRFWLYESQGDVKIVLALTVSRKAPEITIEKWELNNENIQRAQTVNISKSQKGDITVRNEPLVIEFEKLFLRDPEIPKETDIHIDSSKLEKLAGAIWCAQDF